MVFDTKYQIVSCFTPILIFLSLATLGARTELSQNLLYTWYEVSAVWKCTSTYFQHVRRLRNLTAILTTNILRSETSQKQWGNGVGNYKVSPTAFRNFMNSTKLGAHQTFENWGANTAYFWCFWTQQMPHAEK